MSKEPLKTTPPLSPSCTPKNHPDEGNRCQKSLLNLEICRLYSTFFPSAFAGNGIYESSDSHTLIFVGIGSSNFEHVWNFGRHTLHHSRALAISGSTFGPQKTSYPR